MDPRLNRLFLILVLVVSVSAAANSAHASDKACGVLCVFHAGQSEKPSMDASSFFRPTLPPNRACRSTTRRKPR